MLSQWAKSLKHSLKECILVIIRDSKYNVMLSKIHSTDSLGDIAHCYDTANLVVPVIKSFD